ncbi:MAG: hypothetical protein GF416_09495 [Candidatus Altiarchaeales archaeon]|nr:hypothetical protein [Candidatus Altiarchaeales archaeon]MBD3417353.1 hypothetical protein [Candidatus Altiarchaeales archaeon]
MAEEYVGRKFETEFVEGDPPHSEIVGEIISAGKALHAMGLTPENAGNISVRTENGLLITVGGVSKGELNPDDVVEVVDFNFSRVKAVGRKEPSSEVPMHWLIYQCYPMAKAVIHAHDMLAVDNADKLKLTAGVHSTKEMASYGTEDQAYQVVEALKHVQYAVIRGHGIVCMGESLDEALELIINVHKSLKK